MMKRYASFSLEDPINKHDTSKMAINATSILNQFEEKLKDNKWVAGNQMPSLIDCHVYSLTALIANNTVPFTQLRVHIQQCPNLMKYIERFRQHALANDGFSSQNNDKGKIDNEETKKDQESNKHQTHYTGQEDEEDPKVIRKRYILSGLVATLSMFAYSVIKGIVSVSFMKNIMSPFNIRL